VRAAIIVNPAAGRGRTARLLRQHLQTAPPRGWSIEVLETRARGHAGELARALAHDPPDRVAVCGGDGTLNEVVTALPAPGFPVGLIPAGTANVLRCELGLPADPAAALRIALEGRVKRVDLGVLRSSAERRFLLMAGVGFDAFVAERVSLALKARVGVFAYYTAAARCLAGYRFPRFRVATEQGEFEASSCILANARSYGGGLVLTPGADMTDGLLDLLVVEGSPRLAYARVLLSARLGRPVELAVVKRLRVGGEVRLEGPPDVAIQVDGEPCGGLPAVVSVEREVFPLVVGI
jgi:YegS/Rv2252/BmrU family lipid kinase